MRNAGLSLRPSDIPELVRLWPEYYGQEAIDKARQRLLGRRVGSGKRLCAAKELDCFLAGGAMSKTRRLELFRAFLKQLGKLQALLIYCQRKEQRQARQYLPARPAPYQHFHLPPRPYEWVPRIGPQS